jgi:predicted nucleotide-binding protein
MKLEGFDSLINQGRSLLTDTDLVQAHEGFEEWVDNVADWLQKIAPDSGLSAEWSGLGTSRLMLGGYAFNDPVIWRDFTELVENRLTWLSRLARAAQAKSESDRSKTGTLNPSGKLFIVHGRNESMRESVARFIEKLDLIPLILHEQPNKGRTIIDKFMDYSDVSFAVVILSGDDRGGMADSPHSEQKLRVRQNVLLELGFFLGKLGRKNVCAIYEEGVELPSDYDGVLYIKYDSDGAWKMLLARELKAAGLPFDLNKAVQ